MAQKVVGNDPQKEFKKVGQRQNLDYDFVGGKKKRAEWFCQIWKPQIKASINVDGKQINQYYASKDGVLYMGTPWYDQIETYLNNWADKHSGGKWAYAYHERGHNMPEFEHENCEHIHFVIRSDNPCHFTAVQKAFPTAHIEAIRYKIENCGQYLLHLGVSAERAGKERIPFSDLYCSGNGEHGQIWFPLISSVSYETFVPSETIHLVYNEGMHHILQFISRFGASVCHGAYRSIILECLSQFQEHQFSLDDCYEIFALMSEKKQQYFLRMITGRSVSPNEILDYWVVVSDRHSEQYNNLFFQLECVYIWWKNTARPMTETLFETVQMFEIQSMLDLNDERTRVFELITSNGIFADKEVANGK